MLTLRSRGSPTRIMREQRGYLPTGHKLQETGTFGGSSQRDGAPAGRSGFSLLKVGGGMQIYHKCRQFKHSVSLTRRPPLTIPA